MTSNEREPLLKMEHVSVAFPVKKDFPFQKKRFVKAVTDVSLEIYPGETFGVVGESGCGKSTLANCTLGMQRVDAGKIFFDGQELTAMNERRLKEARRSMQVIFQDPFSSLNPRFSVFELISEPLRIKGGYTVDLGGVEAFLPASHVDLRPVPDMDALVGQQFEFRVLKINRRRSNVIVSRRVLLEEERDTKRAALLQTLAEGQIVKGKAKNITEYGVFVDLGGLDGLLHITDMSWKRIRHPREMVSLGQELELKVLSFDKENQKVSLGLKQLVPDPWQDITARFPEGSHHVGKVTNLVDYGVFVELEPGVEGLVHISEMSWTRKLRHPSQMVHQGDEVEVVILGVDSEKKRISLGMKQVKPNPWELVGERFPEGTVIEGVIKNITEFGMFIGIEDGIDGLIHVSDISWTKKIRHPGELYKVGDVVQAKVLTVDQENEKFTLGMKQLTEDPWSTVPARYPVGNIITGTVTNVTDFGLFVEVEEGIEGLIHVTELGKKVKSPSELCKEGDVGQAKSMHVSADERRLGLSIKQIKDDEERRKPKDYHSGDNSISQTLGDLLKQKFND